MKPSQFNTAFRDNASQSRHRSLEFFRCHEASLKR